jgi:hypothetical protein
MTHPETAFDVLLNTARDLDITIITGRLWPPQAGALSIGDRSLEEIVLPHATADEIALAIIPGGPGWEHIRYGNAVLDAGQLARLERVVAEAGGHVYRGRLAVRTPAEWLQRHGGPPPDPGISAFEVAQAAGWPAAFGDTPVLFLDDQPLYYLLARENVGRNATLLVAPIAHQAPAVAQATASATK